MLTRTRAALAAAALAAATATALAAPAAAAPAPAPTVTHLLRQAPAPPAGPHTALPAPARAAGNTVLSSNWAGWAASACATCRIRYVQTQFNMASVNCAVTADAYASHWAGLDGFNTGTVEQTGVLAFCSRGTPQYLAWYEMYPNPPVYFTGTIAPGDAFTAAVYYNQATNRWQIGLTDTTTGASLATAQPCATCQNRSAEVITEAPSSSTGVLPLADFAAENYTGSLVTSYNGTRGTLAGNALWASDSLTMVGPSDVKAAPSGLQGGQAFSVTWQHAT